MIAQDLADELRQDEQFLDVCRLFLGMGQEPAAHVISGVLGQPISWTKLRAVARREPDRIAEALDDVQLPELIQSHLDFAIPTRKQPKAVIEAKGFEATGSKLTDFLGDILKIGQAKDFHMYFFLVTDGRGWHNRVSDLRKIVEYHRDNLIDMIYTRARLADLAADVKHIYENE